MGSELPKPQLGLVLTGGGARAAYQVRVLQYISDYIPQAGFSILIGVSAGAINAAHLANHPGRYRDATSRLLSNWREIRSEHVFEMESLLNLFRSFLSRTLRGDGTRENMRSLHAFADTAPLRGHLEEDRKSTRLNSSHVKISY